MTPRRPEQQDIFHSAHVEDSYWGVLGWTSHVSFGVICVDAGNLMGEGSNLARKNWESWENAILSALCVKIEIYSNDKIITKIISPQKKLGKKINCEINKVNKYSTGWYPDQVWCRKTYNYPNPSNNRSADRFKTTAVKLKSLGNIDKELHSSFAKSAAISRLFYYKIQIFPQQLKYL